MVNLLVEQVGSEDIFTDIARVHRDHRPGIRAGRICRIHCNGASILASARGSRSNRRDTIRLDNEMRRRLGVSEGASYEFSITRAGLWGEFLWAWRASDPTSRIAARLAALSVLLGMTGLLLGVIALFF